MATIGDRHGKKRRDPVLAQTGELSRVHLGTFAQRGEAASPDEETICGDVLKAVRGQLQRLAGSSIVSSREGLARVEAMLGVVSNCYVKGVDRSIFIPNSSRQNDRGSESGTGTGISDNACALPG